jgi:hypothetical protein
MVHLDFVSVSVSSASVTTVVITITILTMVVQVVGNPQTFTHKTGNGKLLTCRVGPMQEKPLVHAHQESRVRLVWNTAHVGVARYGALVALGTLVLGGKAFRRRQRRV